MQTLWIGNRAVVSDSADAIQVVNPAAEELIDEIPSGCKADVEHAVGAARRAQRAWAALSPAERRNALKESAQRARTFVPKLAQLLTAENGKTLAQAEGEIRAAVDFIDTFAEMAVHVRAGTQMSAAGELMLQQREARGVAACIVPWNYPISAGLGNVIPNLAVGNTVVWKPSEKTPLSSRFLVEAAFQHLPAGVLNMVLGDGLHCGEHLVRSPEVNVVCFIGSEKTGRRIGEICGASLKRCILELGGKDPLIVDETVDVGAAARLAAEATYANAGQICTSTERIYIQRRIFDAFLDALIKESRALRLGGGFEPDIQMGPLVDALQLAKVTGHVEDASKRGATVHCGGVRLNRRGYFFPPTVLTGITPEMQLMDEETFGPIAPLMPYDEFDEAIALANQGRYGLAAIVCTASAPRAIKAIQELEAGMVKINTMRGRNLGATSEPFKASGLGHGYGIEMLHELTIQKAVHWRGAPR